MSHMGMVLAAIVFSAAVSLSSTSSAEIYRYVDSEGELNVVSDLSMIPVQYRDAAIAEEKSRSGGSLNIVEGLDDAELDAPAAPSAQGQSAFPGAATTSTPSQIAGHDQLWWQNGARDRQKKVADLEGQLETAKADEDDWSNQIYRRPGGRGSHAGKRHGEHHTGAALALSDDDDTYEPTAEELEAMLNEAEQDLGNFHEQARQAGVPPGWLR
jgi:hypothetical protein